MVLTKCRKGTLLACWVAAAGVSVAQSSQTAQSIQVSSDALAGGSFQIEESGEWVFDGRGAASVFEAVYGLYFTASTTGSPSAQNLQQAKHQALLANRCNFWHGTALQSHVWENVNQGWSVTSTPIQPGIYPPATAWTFNADAEGSGQGSVEIDIEGFVASESYVAKGIAKKFANKYSFTLRDSYGASRVLNLTFELFKEVDGDLILVDSAPLSHVLSDGLDWYYEASIGVSGSPLIFGNSAVYGALHAPGYKPGALVSDILLQDNFAGNTLDAASTRGDFGGVTTSISEAGDYILVISGTLKGNDAKAPSQPFIVIGGGTSVNPCTN